MHRRNSDSSLYCKAWYGEEPEERAIRPVTNQAKYLDQERLAFVQSYLEKAEDARSMTTETSDSGMPGTHGTASQLGMEDATESPYQLSLKDLSEQVVAELTIRLQCDSVAKEQFCHSFGLDPNKMHNAGVLKDISELFPDTPVRLLKDISEALQLYDLAELLDKAKPRTLRPALPLEEIGNLSNASNRPTTFYSKAAVLIIDPTRSANDTAERIASFFKDLNSESEVSVISVRQKLEVLRQMKMLKKKSDQKNIELYHEELFKDQLKQVMEERELLAKRLENTLGRDGFLEYGLAGLTARESHIRKELEMAAERRKQFTENEEQLVEEIKQKEQKLQQEKDKLKMAVATVVDKWTHIEDKKSTLFVVFEISGDGTLRKLLAEKMTSNDAKLLITPSTAQWKGLEEMPESLHVMYCPRFQPFLDTMLKVLSKRWQTLDLISMMRELQRTLPHMVSGHVVTINDSLSSLPRLQKTVKDM